MKINVAGISQVREVPFIATAWFCFLSSLKRGANKAKVLGSLPKQVSYHQRKKGRVFIGGNAVLIPKKQFHMLVSGSVDECHHLSTWKVTQTTEVPAPHRQGQAADGSTQRLRQLWESFSGALMSVLQEHNLWPRQEGNSKKHCREQKICSILLTALCHFSFFLPLLSKLIQRTLWISATFFFFSSYSR